MEITHGYKNCSVHRFPRERTVRCAGWGKREEWECIDCHAIRIKWTLDVWVDGVQTEVVKKTIVQPDMEVSHLLGDTQ